MPDSRCLTCHSKIGSDSTTETSRSQGKEGTDSNGNPVPRWTDDPLFTGQGFNGITYGGRRNRVRFVHIKELQDVRKAKETEAGFTESQKTQFSNISNDRHISRRHIIEIRESTEKLLNDSGATLEDYFKLDEDENVQPQNLKVGTTAQSEWIDVNRGEEFIDSEGVQRGEFLLPNGSTQQSPTLPHNTRIRAIHVEDLRHPVSPLVPALLIDMGGGLYHGARQGVANFKNVEIC